MSIYIQIDKDNKNVRIEASRNLLIEGYNNKSQLKPIPEIN